MRILNAWNMVTIKKHIKYTLVDFDDTVIYTSYANFLAYKKAIYDVLGISIKYIDERFTHNILLEIVQDKLKIDKILHLKNKYYNDNLQYTLVNKELLDLLCKHEKINIILVTNGNQNRVEKTLAHHNLQDFFHNKFYIKNNNIYESKYINAYNTIINNTNNIDNFFIIENSEFEILKALNNGFKKENIYKIHTKVYEGEIYE